MGLFYMRNLTSACAGLALVLGGCDRLSNLVVPKPAPVKFTPFTVNLTRQQENTLYLAKEAVAVSAGSDGLWSYEEQREFLSYMGFDVCLGDDEFLELGTANVQGARDYVLGDTLLEIFNVRTPNNGLVIGKLSMEKLENFLNRDQ